MDQFSTILNYIKKDMLLVLSKEGEDYIQFKQVIIYWYFYLTSLFMEFNSSKLNFKNITIFFSKLNMEKYYVAPFFFPLNYECSHSHFLFVYLLGKLDILLNVMLKALKYMKEKKILNRKYIFQTEFLNVIT